MAICHRLLTALLWARWGAQALLNPKPVPASEALMVARVRFFEEAMVSCKGQVFQGGTAAILSEGWGAGEGANYFGLGFNKGSCLSDEMSQGGPQCMDPIEMISQSKETDSNRLPSNDQYSATRGSRGSVGGPLDTIVVLTQPQPGAYYHLVVESLSRFFAVQRQYPRLVENKQTLFHVGATSEVGQAWARLVGIKTETGKGNRLLGGCWWARTVVWPPSNGCTPRGGADGEGMRLMNGAVQKALLARGAALRGAPAPRRALLIRRTQHGRVVRNHAEVHKALLEALPGWEVEVFSDDAIPDVLTVCGMFHRARLVIGPHGAGFANLLCAQQGTPVIEFQEWHNPAHPANGKDFQILSGKLGLPYFGVPTETSHTEALDISIPKVKEAVKAALQQLPG